MPQHADADSATAGYEQKLWEMANALRGSMDAAEYKHVVLGLIFLRYISDAFEERREATEAEGVDDPEDLDVYRAKSIFWVPPEARWAHPEVTRRDSPLIGQLVDDAMSAIERDNPALKDVLPKDYAREALDKQRLGQLIDLVTNIEVGSEQARSTDVLGRVYEYFPSQFASAEGKKGGEFYTARSVVVTRRAFAVSRPLIAWPVCTRASLRTHCQVCQEGRPRKSASSTSERGLLEACSTCSQARLMNSASSSGDQRGSASNSAASRRTASVSSTRSNARLPIPRAGGLPRRSRENHRRAGGRFWGISSAISKKPAVTAPCLSVKTGFSICGKRPNELGHPPT